jgi:hypothetical protein
MNKNIYMYGLTVDEDKFTNSKVFSTRYYLLQHCKTFLPENPIVAEVGVAEGFFSNTILQSLTPSKMYLIDFYNHASPYGEYSSTNHYNYISNKFKDNNKITLIKYYSVKLYSNFRLWFLGLKLLLKNDIAIVKIFLQWLLNIVKTPSSNRQRVI